MLIYDLTKEEINEFLLRNGHKKYRTDQVWDWVYKKKVKNFSDMKNIPKDIIDLLSENFHFNALELVLKEESSDGTIKFLYGLQDKNLIETVLMTHSYGKSVCVTTQVGCNIGCSFCASGVLRKKRDLTAGEIIAQIVDSEILFGERISHIVVMGIGEPFDNYNNLLKFLRTVNDPQGLEIGARHITVSTSGLANKIKDFADFELQVNLALSLHAPNNEIRSQLMKINKAYPIEKVLESIDYYIEKTNRRVTIEYILIHDLNDSVATAMELARLLRGMNVYVNLIPYNEVIEAGYKRSSRQNQFAFFDALKKSGINCTLRKEQGHDINAACGQLRSKQEAKEL